MGKKYGLRIKQEIFSRNPSFLIFCKYLRFKGWPEEFCRSDASGIYALFLENVYLHYPSLYDTYNWTHIKRALVAQPYIILHILLHLNVFFEWSWSPKLFIKSSKACYDFLLALRASAGRLSLRNVLPASTTHMIHLTNWVWAISHWCLVVVEALQAADCLAPPSKKTWNHSLDPSD